jgi:hypothetical protein
LRHLRRITTQSYFYEAYTHTVLSAGLDREAKSKAIVLILILKFAKIKTLLHSSVDTMPLAQLLELKVGAQVMLRKNISSRLVNGSRGVIVNFVPRFS